MARPIMIQGTMSNVGKSLFAAALCRIFKQDGYRVAPFKSQNMALNSFITKEGLEMGRAQVMQAEAAGIEPEVSMNPILLKPTTDVGSQVIVNGKVVGNMKAREYFKQKRAFIPDIMKAYHRLEEGCDIIVIEGAGSPAELNLKSDDIVNMGLARLTDAPVLLVGDIDRGGVFAQLIGTCDLLEPEERARVKGLVVNKFRGDVTLFDEGVRILEEKSGIPVAGVVPYIYADIDDEDSLSDKLIQREAGVIDIAVIRFPRISNFTDFDIFNQYKGVRVRYVCKKEELENPDLIILPGTKSTIADLKWFRETGLEAAVKKCIYRDIPLFGICGGYQMLGNSIADPKGTEGEKETDGIRGMELLNMATVFGQEKTQTRVSGCFNRLEGIFKELSGKEFFGYEIHMGETKVKGDAFLQALGSLEDGKKDGVNRGNIYGTYVHGIFDRAEVSEVIVKALYKRKGIDFEDKAMDRRAYKEKQYDILAEAVRKSIDMKFIYDIISL